MFVLHVVWKPCCIITQLRTSPDDSDKGRVLAWSLSLFFWSHQYPYEPQTLKPINLSHPQPSLPIIINMNLGVKFWKNSLWEQIFQPSQREVFSWNKTHQLNVEWCCWWKTEIDSPDRSNHERDRRNRKLRALMSLGYYCICSQLRAEESHVERHQPAYEGSQSLGFNLSTMEKTGRLFKGPWSDFWFGQIV